MLTCHAIECNTKLVGKQRKYCCRRCKNSLTNNKFQSYDAQKKRGLARKMEIVKCKGGKCAICGYDKNLAGLCFHHIDDSTKDISLDARHLSNNSMITIMRELEKCELLCHNCHMETHYPDLIMVGLLGLEPRT